MTIVTDFFKRDNKGFLVANCENKEATMAKYSLDNWHWRAVIEHIGDGQFEVGRAFTNNEANIGINAILEAITEEV